MLLNPVLVDIESVSIVKPKSLDEQNQPKRPDPTEPGFFSRCEDPTRKDIAIASLATSLRSMVKRGSISRSEADRQLNEYKQRLQGEPFGPDFWPFMMASKSLLEDEISEKIRRPGISPEFLRAQKIRHVDVEEADSLLGFHPTSGGVWIFIP
jgi:hypothetical protein